MTRFYATPDSFVRDTVTLDPDESHHLRNVLRLVAGDEANVFDGTGAEFNCVVETTAARGATLRIVAQTIPAAPESPLDLTLAACQLPGEAFDLVVQKAVELGVRRLVPLRSIRTEVPSGGVDKRHVRWQRIALGATKQCGRATLMAVERPAAFVEQISAIGADSAICFFSEREGIRSLPTAPAKKITAFVGPKGGWDDSELETARSRGAEIVTLGGRILRAETAAIALTAILQHRFGDLN